MRFLLSIFLLFLFLSSCQEKQGQSNTFALLQKSCDEIDMIFYSHHDTLVYKTSDSLEIATLLELISNKNDEINDSCISSGQLVYKKMGKIIFKAEFSTTNSNDSISCDYVTYSNNGNIYKHGLTYSAGMFIDDILWSKLKWSSLINNGPIRLHGDTGGVKKTFSKTPSK